MTVEEGEVGKVDAEECKEDWKSDGLNGGLVGGRQENSLGTILLNSQVLYTNTGWSVHRP